jgi:hypothetical protein
VICSNPARSSGHLGRLVDSMGWGARAKFRERGAVAAPRLPERPAEQPPPQAEQKVFTVTLPPGVMPGQNMQVQSPFGGVFMVQVPPGMGPGGQIQVQAPAPVGPAASAVPDLELEAACQDLAEIPVDVAEAGTVRHENELCLSCASRPRAVRFMPCGHAVMCELCTIAEMQRTGKCPNCRTGVGQLVVVALKPTDPAMPSHLDVPETGGREYESVQQFLESVPGVFLNNAEQNLSRAVRPGTTAQVEDALAPVNRSMARPGPRAPVPINRPHGGRYEARATPVTCRDALAAALSCGMTGCIYSCTRDTDSPSYTADYNWKPVIYCWWRNHFNWSCWWPVAPLMCVSACYADMVHDCLGARFEHAPGNRPSAQCLLAPLNCLR